MSTLHCILLSSFLFLQSPVRGQEASSTTQLTDTLTLSKFEPEVYEANKKFFSFDNTQVLVLEPNQYYDFTFVYKDNISKTGKSPILWIYTFPRELKRYQIRIYDIKQDKHIWGRQPKRSQINIFNLRMTDKQALLIEFQNKESERIELVVGWLCQFCKEKKILTEKRIERAFEHLEELDKMNKNMNFYKEIKRKMKETYLENQVKSHSNLYMWSVCESLFILLVGVGQIYTMKNLLQSDQLFK